jgi:hypothetical protein
MKISKNYYRTLFLESIYSLDSALLISKIKIMRAMYNIFIKELKIATYNFSKGLMINSKMKITKEMLKIK